MDEAELLSPVMKRAAQRRRRGLYRNLGDEEDVAQEAAVLAIKVLRRRPWLLGEDCEGYLHVTVRNLLYDEQLRGGLVRCGHKYGKKRGPWRSVEADLYEQLVVVADSKDDFLEREKLGRSLAKLREKDRETLTLRYGLGGGEMQTYRRVGELLGLGKRGVEYRVEEALGALRRLMGATDCQNGSRGPSAVKNHSEGGSKTGNRDVSSTGEV